MKNISISIFTILLLLLNCSGGKLVKNGKIKEDQPLENNTLDQDLSNLKKLGILKFKSNQYYQNDSLVLYLNMISYARKQKLFNLINQELITNTWYPYSNTKSIPSANITNYQSICTQYKLDYLVVGRIYSQYRIQKIEFKLYSKNENQIIYSTTETINNNLSVQDMAKVAIGRIYLKIDGKLPEMKYLKVSKGNSYSSIELNWQVSGTVNHYKVLRSTRYYGPYEIIVETASTSYTDTSAEAGLKYWYIVYPVVRSIPSDSLISFGYRKPPNPQSLSVKEIINKRTRSWPSLSGPEKSKEKKWISFWEEYYESYFTASLIYLIGKMYVNSGRLLVFRDFDSYFLDYKTRMLYLTKDKIKIKLYSGRLVRFLNKFEKEKSVSKDEALDRIIKNCLAFCLRTGETEYKTKDGLTRYIPYYESIGISTEYHRDYKKWRSNTIIFGTYDKKLKKQLYSAWRKGV